MLFLRSAIISIISCSVYGQSFQGLQNWEILGLLEPSLYWFWILNKFP